MSLLLPSPPPPETPLLVLGGGGRWTRRNGRGDACAARRQWRVKADSETRSAIGGGSFDVVGSFGIMVWGARGDSDSDGWWGSVPAAVAEAYLYTTPSSSRRYAGPIFLFSALHCERTRNLRRFAIVRPIGAAVASRGSECVGFEFERAPTSRTERDKTRTGRSEVYIAGNPPPSDQVDSSVVASSYMREGH